MEKMQQNNNKDHLKASESALLSIEEELKKFEQEERSKLGLVEEKIEHWVDANPREFTKSQRSQTTLLLAGFTVAHDKLIQSVFRGMGYNMIAIDQPDNEALRYGREYGNRGQCNPTYFTVGNLIKYLKQLQDSGVSTKDIIGNYTFVTAGSCGPCRFGTYVTEYRKALRDAGFEGFRVVQFQQSKGINQETEDDAGLEFGPAFFWYMSRALVIGDVLNLLGYRIRPYEIEPGSTDTAMTNARELLCHAFEKHNSILKALFYARREFSKIKVDRSRIKPKISIIGEFWAMTTEGDGNYGMHRFLEEEGAELEIQTITAWLLYLLWQGRFDTDQRANLKGCDANGTKGSRFGLKGINVRKRLLLIRSGEAYMRGMFNIIARMMGLKGYVIPSMDYIADISKDYYDNNLKGGEGHMEVGKLIANSKYKKVNMTISVKPFGCMPSSGVSDGVQSLITELYPESIFLALETSGDGAVNFYSRIQMQLFKAKQMAEEEVNQLLEKYQLSPAELTRLSHGHSRLGHALHRSPAEGCTTTAAATAKQLLEPQSLISRLNNTLQKTLALFKAESRPQLPFKYTEQTVEHHAVDVGVAKSSEQSLAEEPVLWVKAS